MEYYLQTVFIISVLFLSTLVRSTFGFGDALVAMPILALFVDIRIATPVVGLVASTIAMIILFGSWRQVQLKSAGRLIVSSVAGIPCGLYLLKTMHESMIKIALGCVISGFALYRLSSPISLSLKTEKSSYVFGFLAGAFGGAYNITGPPIVIYGFLRGWNQSTFRATLQGYFFLTGIFILLGHFLSGLWTGPVLMQFTLALPAVFVAVYLGNKLHSRIPYTKFVRYIYILLLIIGVFLFVNNLSGFTELITNP
jgi:uncharacterized membrane protein YfcA